MQRVDPAVITVEKLLGVEPQVEWKLILSEDIEAQYDRFLLRVSRINSQKSQRYYWKVVELVDFGTPAKTGIEWHKSDAQKAAVRYMLSKL